MRIFPHLALLLLATLFSLAPQAQAASSSGLRVEVLVNGHSRTEYRHNGSVYIEASKGASYTIRLTNTEPVRIAVALAVDGRNTIDGAHSSPKSSRKWVLDPYESVIIPGWQTSSKEARGFFFTSEDRSYAAALGDASNAGVIEAVAFRERMIYPDLDEITRFEQWEREEQPYRGREKAKSPASPPPRASASAGASGTATREGNRARKPQSAPKPQASEDYAATGMGTRRSNRVQQVSLELEASASARVRVRYGFHDELVELGVLPDPSPLSRREQAQGFADFCPQP